MARPRSQMKLNIREIQRAIKSLDSAMSHIYNLKLSYDDHKDYQLKTFGRVNRHTSEVLDAIDLLASSCGQSITILNLTLDDIRNPESVS